MKKVIIFGLLILTIGTVSCSKDSSISEQPIIISNSLEGVWRLQNLQSATKLTFSGQNFTLDSGTVTIKGVFQISGGTLQGTVTSRQGTSSDLVQPDVFIGDFTLTGNTVSFNNFNGNWRVPFSSWYQRQ